MLHIYLSKILCWDYRGSLHWTVLRTFLKFKMIAYCCFISSSLERYRLVIHEGPIGQIFGGSLYFKLLTLFIGFVTVCHKFPLIKPMMQPAACRLQSSSTGTVLCGTCLSQNLPRAIPCLLGYPLLVISFTLLTNHYHHHRLHVTVC